MNVAQHWQAIAELLDDNQRHWQSVAFKATDLNRLPIFDEQPDLVAALLALSDDELERLQGDDDALLQFMSPRWPLAPQISSLIALPYANAQIAEIDEARLKQLNQSIPGRKWQQLQAFSAALNVEPVSATPEILVDCCCGKGHLSRFVAEQYQRPVMGLELDLKLVEQAKQLSLKLDLKQCRFYPCDVLSSDFEASLRTIPPAHSAHIMALHACGYLHHCVFQQAVKQNLARISLAPCCYHKLFPKEQKTYPFLSKQAQQSKLVSIQTLSFEHVRSSVRQAVTINTRQRQQSQQLQAWRLGFDLLQRDLRVSSRYLNTPSVSTSILSQGFEAFCLHLANQKQLVLPSTIDFQAYQSAGEHKYARVIRLDLVRMAFRRLLELCLVYDQACYLSEQGYRVELKRFCDTSLTPRNLILNAWYQHAKAR